MMTASFLLSNPGEDLTWGPIDAPGVLAAGSHYKYVCPSGEFSMPSSCRRERLEDVCEYFHEFWRKVYDAASTHPR